MTGANQAAPLIYVSRRPIMRWAAALASAFEEVAQVRYSRSGALALSRLMQGLLFGVAPHDPATLTIVAVIMAVVGIGACWIPAYRAAQIDPGVALRAS